MDTFTVFTFAVGFDSLLLRPLPDFDTHKLHIIFPGQKYPKKAYVPAEISQGHFT